VTHDFQFNDWRVVCDPEDGGRLSSLSWRGHALLTTRPTVFHPPAADFGRYETRPVYGYDDCFPTVDACQLSEPPLDAPDHGELCWLPAQLVPGAGSLRCTWVCRAWPGVFTRDMHMGAHTLRWHFTVANGGARPWPYLHVMHALMPPAGVVALRLPACREIQDEIRDAPLERAAAGSPADELLATPEGTARMWLLRGLAEGTAAITWNSGLRLTLRFPVDRFPTLGIWWNRRGYPGGPATRRDEFALEPMPGPCSSLARCAASRQAPTVAPGDTASWDIEWSLEDLGSKGT
jgi:hypothetical protein